MTDRKLEVIDLDQKRTGYRQFLSCWLLKDDDVTFVVDPGPGSTIGHLIESIKSLDINKIDYVLLTHIHLDHGGGTAELLRSFPNARVFCHEIGVKHMIDPSKLWQGSVKVLGEVARMYTAPDPVPAEKMANSEELKERGIEVIPTSGHAPHHVSFLYGDILFAGEAIGTRVDLGSGMPYLRPSTPPKFILDKAIKSLDRLLALDPEPKKTVFAHYGLTEDCFSWCREAKTQLNLWIDTVRALHAESGENLEQRLFDKLMEVDPFYGQGRFDEMAEDFQTRERDFLANTLDGMLGYIKSSL